MTQSGTSRLNFLVSYNCKKR